MQHTVVKLRFLPATCLGALFWLVFPIDTRSVDDSGGLITLDPLCLPKNNLPLAPGNPAPSTRRMAQRLADSLEHVDPMLTMYLSDRIANALGQQMTNATDVKAKASWGFELGKEQTRAGRPDAALNTFAAMERLLAENSIPLNERSRVELRTQKALAFLRLGEQENCLATHNADSCVFPLQPRAYHRLPRGSRGAIALFNQQLAEYPNDLGT